MLRYVPIFKIADLKRNHLDYLSYQLLICVAGKSCSPPAYKFCHIIAGLMVSKSIT